MLADTSDRAATEKTTPADAARQALDRYDAAAGLLRFWWVVLIGWVGLTVWLFASIGRQ